MRTLTLENRKKIELMWGNKESPVKIAAEVDTELKRRQCLKAGVDMTLDKNLRPAYSAERGGPYTKEICGTVVAVQKNVPIIRSARYEQSREDHDVARRRRASFWLLSPFLRLF